MTSVLSRFGLVAAILVAASQTAHAQWQSRFSRYPTYESQRGPSCNCERDKATRAAQAPPPVSYPYESVSYSSNRWDTRQWTPRNGQDRLNVSEMTDPYWMTPSRGWGTIAEAPAPRNPVSLGIDIHDYYPKKVPDPVYLDTPQFDSSSDWEVVPSRRHHAEPRYDDRDDRDDRHVADRDRRSERWDRTACLAKEPWCDDDEDSFIEAPTAALVFQTIISSRRY